MREEQPKFPATDMVNHPLQKDKRGIEDEMPVWFKDYQKHKMIRNGIQQQKN